ncbi:MAG: acyl-ACP--UDP-N-acetylglucosamine O-acyltransferase, partial [Bdellovibrionales bacterium]|nr:acyl-ACP--UDP-N-acetylglucosamine O-acyltransferase [Bdellovibrionales bacterium]
HVVVDGRTTLGDENRIFPFAAVGTAPQDLKYEGEPSTLSIGDKNIIREYVTLQPGTKGGGMKTTIGSMNLFMACSHIGHDSSIGNGNVFANSCAISGHVDVGSFVIVGGLAGVHQFVRLGDHCFLGAGAMVAQDIPPFVFAEGNRAQIAGINKIGLKRRGFSPAEIRVLFRVFQETFYGEGAFRERVLRLYEEYRENEYAAQFFKFISESRRGIASGRKVGSDTVDNDSDQAS